MALPHGTIKSGQTRGTNCMGATNRMVSFVDRLPKHTKPVSINYLRVMLKNLNKSIPMLASEPRRQAAMIVEKQHVYNAIKLFQKAYAVKDFSALPARNYCRLNNIPLPSERAVTMRQMRDGVQRVADSLGAGHFDELGLHIVDKDGKPRIPGGYNSGDRELLGAEIDRKDASVVFSTKDVPLSAKLKAQADFQGYLHRVVRQKSGADYKRAVRGSVNGFTDRVTGKFERIPNAPVVPDRKRR